MIRKIIGFIICIIFVCSAPVFADTVHLKNGNKISGIITKENETSIEIKINIGATVSFSKEDIGRIERDSDAEHTKIQDSWEDERSSKKVEAIEEEAFIEQQKQKGLIEHEGEWVTPEEKERLQAKGIAKGFDKAHKKRRFSYKRDKGERSSFADKLLARGEWFVRETEHFSVFYRDVAQAKIVSDKAEYYFEKISYDLGYEGKIKWDKKCQVYIEEDVDKWKKFLKDIGFDPELVGGFVPNYTKGEMFLCAVSDGYLAITFPHELTHLIFREIAGKSTIPLWLNEGLANYEASVTSISNKLLIKQIKKGKHILLGDLLRMGYPKGKEMRELFYAQSEKLVEFLIVQYGRKKFRRFCDLILKDRSFKDSLFIAYKGDFEDIEDFNIKLVEYIVK